ncbi:helicase [Aureococcus anophagefferens]|nr:helicase [Aureococcus anophagefferens]
MARWTKKPDVPLASGAMPSLLFNNLSAVSRLLARRRRPPVPKSPGNPPAQAYCHGDEVSIVDLSNGSKRSLPFRQKPVKVFDAKLCSCNGALILVVAVIDGVQLWQLDAGIKSLRMLLCHNLSSGSRTADEVANPRRPCCGAFASGHVRVYDLASSYGKLAELQAHTRCVTALAVDDKGLELATVSEDSFLHVWSLEPRDGAGGDEAKADGADPSLALTYSHQVTDAVLTGVQFVAPAPGAGKAPDVAVTAYDVDALKRRAARFFRNEKAKLAPFVEAKRLGALCGPKGAKDGPLEPFVIGNRESYVQAALRDYQVVGVNWFLERHALGVGGILGDEMGLGKTNWVNEIKKFTPSLTVAKVHGSIAERERVLGDVDVASGAKDVYLTTYDTLLAEEAFFTEAFEFHVVVIDEGHRLKNATSKLARGLRRVPSPFRVLLTGTPLQNNLGELWALLQFADVESTLLPKIEYVLKPPLFALQRALYRSFLQREGDDVAAALLTPQQLLQRVLQLAKVANHPKTLSLTYDREVAAAACRARQAVGAEFVTVSVDDALSDVAKARDRELRGLAGAGLVRSSGKLALLDRLLARKKAAGSRVLLFSQFTLTLDVLEEYCAAHHGDRGVGYLRLDGATGRIQREMDMRSFNASESKIFLYLISTRAGGQGINLATADTVVLYDTCWNPQVDLQAMDRAHRIGQRGQVTVYRLIARDTVEEKVHARAHQKLLLDALVMNGAPRELSDEGEAADLEKLDVTELWSILSAGAAAMFDPTAEQGEDPTDELLDKLIDDARPNDVRAVRVAEEPSAERPAADLAGTIFERDGAVASSSDDEGSDGGLRSAADLEADLKARGLPLTGLKLAIAGAGRRRALQELLELDARTTVFPEDGLNPCAADVPRLRREAAARSLVVAGASTRGGWTCCGRSCPRSTRRDGAARRQAAPRAQGDEDHERCDACGRRSSDAGGALFHCTSCPVAYCFDCCPDEHVDAGSSQTVKARSLASQLEKQGVNLRSWLFFTCGACAAAKAAKAEKLKKAAEKRERERERERALYPMGGRTAARRASGRPAPAPAPYAAPPSWDGGPPPGLRLRRLRLRALRARATGARAAAAAAAAGGHFYSIGGLPKAPAPRPCPTTAASARRPTARRAPTARAATYSIDGAAPPGVARRAQARRPRPPRRAAAPARAGGRRAGEEARPPAKAPALPPSAGAAAGPGAPAALRRSRAGGRRADVRGDLPMASEASPASKRPREAFGDVEARRWADGSDDLRTSLRRGLGAGLDLGASADFDARYELLAPIGSGAFSVVRGVKSRSGGGAPLCVKTVDVRPLRLRPNFSPRRLLREATILSKITHPNVVRYVGCYEGPDALRVVLERAPGRELFEVILERQSLPEADARPVVAQLTSALAYLHANSVAHRDVKPENVLVDRRGDEWRATLIDFGLSKVIKTTPSGDDDDLPVLESSAGRTFVGTPCYLAPEIEAIHRGGEGAPRHYGVEVDAWSLGAVLHVSLVARFPEFDRSSGRPLVKVDGPAFARVLAAPLGAPTAFEIDSLVELQQSIGACLGGAFESYAHLPEMSQRIRGCAVLCRSQLLENTKLLRKIEQTAAGALDLHEDLELSVASGEPPLALQLLTTCKKWVIFDNLLQKSEHIEQFLEYSAAATSPERRIMGRFHQRLAEYKMFWLKVRDMAHATLHK